MIIYTPQTKPPCPCPGQGMNAQRGLGDVGFTLDQIDSSLPNWDITYVMLAAIGGYLAWHFIGNSKSGKRKALYKVRERYIADQAALRAS